MKRADLSLVARAIAMVLPAAVKKAMREELPAAVEQRFAALPVPKDGTSVTVDDVRPLVAELVDGLAVDIVKALEAEFPGG